MFSTNDERMLKGEHMARDFYPFVEKEGEESGSEKIEARHPARIAVYDDASAAPRVVVIEPGEVRSYLEEITATVSRLSKEQGGNIPFMVIREIVENFIHAYFQAPTITILDDGNTIRFSDQGPGIKEKSLALEFGTSSATEEMKRYIRGVGSGLPYVQQYMADKGGSLEVEDNIAGGTVVTISTRPKEGARAVSGASREDAPPEVSQPPAYVGYFQQQWQQPFPPASPQAQAYQQMPYGTPLQQPPAQGVPAWQAPIPAPVPSATATPATAPNIDFDERSSQVMDYLSTHESTGPTELVRTYGSSGATWSRTLSSLAAQGVVTKIGQKYHLTGIGRALV